MRRMFFLIVTALCFGLAKSGRCAPATIVSGHARFQVLAENLIRLEYSPGGQFVDFPTVSVTNRSHWPAVGIEQSDKEGWLTLKTAAFELRYKTGSGAFGADNLRIAWKDGGAWKPGDKDDKNLGGVPASLDNRSTTAVSDPGPLSRNGYFLLDDSKSALMDPATNWPKARSETGNQDWYFLVYAHDYKGALARLAQLSGPIPMLPRYTFGAWFGSRAGYSGQQWKMIIQQFRDEHLPVDLLVVDSDSKTKMVWTGYDWDLEQIPDPAEFFSWMTNKGIKVTVNEHYAALTPVSDSHFERIRKAMNLPADTKEIPHRIGNPKYAELFMDLLHKPDLDRGMAFWWQDGAASAGIAGLDDYLWTRHVEYTGSEQITGKRTTAFCRLGSQWGSHRYGIYFTGDLHGVWESLPVLIPATVRGGNQLMPYMNNLCCGVFIVDLDPELYERWIQYSCFSPTIWFHGLWGLRLPWEYGPAGVENYRKFVGLRYQLLPYIYTCSRISHETGLPLLRGMYLEYPQQESSYNSQQQYMFGPDLLVSPIITPCHGDAARKDVFLPEGDDWYDFFTGDLYTGGRTITHESTMDRMPVFVRAGSIIPMGPVMDFSDDKPVDPLTLEVYPGTRAASFDLYEDDGTSLDYRHGAYSWTPLRFAGSGPDSHELTIGKTRGTFKGQLRRRAYTVRVHGLFEPMSVLLNGHKLARISATSEATGWYWDDRERVTIVRLQKPLSTSSEQVVRISGAGHYGDRLAWQKAWNLRAQFRQIKRNLKLKHAAIVSGPGIKKPPRVIRVTEEIEQELTDFLDARPPLKQTPDFAAMEKRIVFALTDQPFESERKIPEVDPESLQGMELMRKAKFTDDEINAIKYQLRGAELPAWLWSHESHK